MEGNAKLIIHQVVHGYEEGHSLLASSSNLSSKEKVTLLKMSDLSGSFVGADFDPYLTAYPIPESNYYAFAKTWYANEMKRPGCVWTHTLLLDKQTLTQLRNLAVLENLFARPERKTLKQYSTPIKGELTLGNITALDRDQVELFSSYLYNRTEVPVFVTGRVAKGSTESILNIWSLQWPSLRRSFSFSTGSFSIRNLNDKPLDFQVFPRAGDLTHRLHSQKSESAVIDTEQVGFATEWFELFRNTDFDKLLTFMLRFGQDIEGHRSKYKSLFLAFQLETHINSVDNSLADSLQFFSKHFPDRKEARLLKLHILGRLFEIDKKNEYYFLIQRLDRNTESFPFDDILFDYSDVIGHLWKNETVSRIELQNIFRRINYDMLGPNGANLLSILPIEAWMKAPWINSKLLTEVLVNRPEIVTNPVIWATSNANHNIWFEAATDLISLQKNQHVLEGLIYAIFVTGNDTYANRIYSNHGGASIRILLKIIGDNEVNLSQKWLEIIAKEPGVFFEWFEKTKPNKFKIILLTRIIDAQHTKLNKLRLDWVKLLEKVRGSAQGDLISDIFTNLLSLAFQNRLESAAVVCAATFQKVHDDARYGNLDDEQWSRLRKSLPKNNLTIPEVNLISRALGFHGDFVPEWDKCEMLRRSLIESFILFRWDTNNVFLSISDMDTFERVVNYCRKSDTGRDFINKLKNSSSAMRFPKHLKVIKKFKKKLDL